MVREGRSSSVEAKTHCRSSIPRTSQIRKESTMDHCICIRNSDYSLYAYKMYVQDANRALDGWYHSKKEKQRRKQIEEKKSHHGDLPPPQTPNPAFCWNMLVCWYCCRPSATLYRCCSNQSHQSRAMSRCIGLAIWPGPLEPETVLGVTVVLPDALSVGL